MVGMQNLIPRWLHQEYDMPDDEMHIPPIAKLEPEFTAQDEDTMVMQKAAVLVQQNRRNIEKAQIDLAEAAMREQSLNQKIDFQEKEIANITLENVEKDNTIASLQTELNEKNTVLSKLLQVLTALDTKLPVKKPRNGKNGNNDNQGHANPAPAK